MIFNAVKVGNFTVTAIAGSNETNNTTVIQNTVNIMESEDTEDVNTTDESNTNELDKVNKISAIKSSCDGGIVNTDLATGNPLIVLLACLLMILVPFRKRKY